MNPLKYRTFLHFKNVSNFYIGEIIEINRELLRGFREIFTHENKIIIGLHFRNNWKFVQINYTLPQENLKMKTTFRCHSFTNF